MTETELDQINLIKNRPKLYSSSPNDNLNSYTTSDISPDEAVQNIPSNEDEIKPAVLDQIRY